MSQPSALRRSALIQGRLLRIQTRKSGFLSQGAYYAYVTKKKVALTQYHAPYMRRPTLLNASTNSTA